MKNCPDCGAKPGENHQSGCDVERCVLCGGQQISCNCVYEVNGIDQEFLEERHPGIHGSGPTERMYCRLDDRIDEYGGRLPWTGEWPGTDEAREFGWYCKWVDGGGWVPCSEDDPNAQPNLNKLSARSRWIAEARKRVKIEFNQ